MDLTEHINKLDAKILNDMDSLPGEELYYRFLALQAAQKIHNPRPPHLDSLELLSPLDAKLGDGRIFSSGSANESIHGAYWAFHNHGVHRSDGSYGHYNWYNRPTMSGWIALRLDEKPLIYEYAISNPAHPHNGRIQDWVLEVSDDSTNGSDGTWRMVDDRPGGLFDHQSRQVFRLKEPVSALWVRLRVTKVFDSVGNDNWSIDLLEYWGKQPDTAPVV